MSYMESSAYCDAENEKIAELADDVTGPLCYDTDKAVSLFYWVRDLIPNRLGLYKQKASETLASGRGSRANKANLLVALLRAARIPAGFHAMQVKTREYVGPLSGAIFRPFLSEHSLHVRCAVLLGGRWLECDPSDDVVLSESTQHLDSQSRKVDFDGTDHALLNMAPGHVVADDGILRREIDEVLTKARQCAGVFPEVLDYYFDFLRRRGKDFSTAKELTAAFVQELERIFPAGREFLLQGWAAEHRIGSSRRENSRTRASSTRIRRPRAALCVGIPVPGR